MTDNFSQNVKQQTDIVRIIGDFVKLKKSGAQNYSGLCPFHKEKSPSFSVNTVHGYFYCFGCHEKGDVFTFVMKMENVGFPEAVRLVAAKSGIALPKREFSSPEEAQEAGLRRHLLEMHEGATQYFEAMLKSPEAARAREYLTARGVTAEAIAKFRIGYAPESFNDMRERFANRFSDEIMRISGLLSAKENEDGTFGSLYARFRRRITFPIMNEQGRVIAFTARALDEIDEKGRPTAKYMNSPETPLYTKGQILFNLDKAKADMRTLDFALLVEGQMDCISVYMAGVKNVLATSGTAFTEMQVRLLSRFTRQVVLNFDPDTAGAAAAEKSIALLTEEDFAIKVVALDGGLDPDRYVRERGIQAYMAALRGAQRYSDYLIERARLQFGTRSPEAKVKAMNFLLPHIRRMPSALQRNEFALDAAQKLGIDSQILLQELKQAAARRAPSVPIRQAIDPVTRNDELLVRALVLPESSPVRTLVRESLSLNPGWYQGLGVESIVEALLHAGTIDNPLDCIPESADRATLAQILNRVHQGDVERIGESVDMLEQVKGALHNLERRSLQRRQRELRTMLAEADRRGDNEMANTLYAELVLLQPRLAAL